MLVKTLAKSKAAYRNKKFPMQLDVKEEKEESKSVSKSVILDIQPQDQQE